MKILGYWLLAIAGLAFLASIFMFPSIGGSSGSSIEEMQKQTENIYESAKLDRLRGFALWIAQSFSLIGAIFVTGEKISKAIAPDSENGTVK